MYDLIWEAELVTLPSPPFMQLNPHFDATERSSSASCRYSKPRERLTEDLVADVVLADEVSEEFLVDTHLVDNLFRWLVPGKRPPKDLGAYSSVPKSASKLNGFQKDRFSLLEGEIVPQTKADAHGTEARRRDLNLGERQCLDHSDCIGGLLS